MGKKSKKEGHQKVVDVEPGADKRLANILKKALNTPPQHVSAPKRKPATKAKS